jgi:hypothetical protein
MVIAEGHKGGERCCVRRTTIHISTIDDTISHGGADSGRSIMKAMEME